MKHYSYCTLVLLFALLLPGQLSGQTQLPAQSKAFYPAKLLNSTVLLEQDTRDFMPGSDYGQSRVPAEKKHWIVFSDRDNNITYTEPNARSTVFSKLSFNEELRIAQIKNGFALVYTEPQKSIEYPKISSRAESKGWVSMSNLLLWHSCPANAAGIYNKALLCRNLDAVDDQDYGGRMYKDPSKKGGYTTMSTDMQFYFVMKVEKGMALLANQHTLEGNNNNVLCGWVASSSFVPWNQRSCLEPTWDEESVSYFSKQKITVSIYDNKGLKVKAGENPPATIGFREDKGSTDINRYRMPPNTFRFPILDDGTADLYNCSSFGMTGASKGTTINQYFAGEDAKVRKTDEAINKLMNINIGIVIDGTKSMDPYFPAVKDAILEGTNYFAKNEKVKFGVVIYRDYADEEGLFESFPMTQASNPKLKEFLEKGGKYGIKSSTKDKSNTEALYYGIDSAIDFFKFKPDESNILLVVGDCGNARDDNKVSDATIIKKLVDKNIHFMGFQVRSRMEDAYTLFNDQLLKIMKNSVQGKYDKLWATMSESDRNGKKAPVVSARPDDNGFTILNNYQNELFIGTYRNAQGAREMKPAELTKLMETAIMECSNTAKYQRETFSRYDAGGWGKNEAVSGQISFDKAFVESRIGHAEDTDGQLLTFKGWTKKKDASGREYYKPVIFISSDEFNVLLTKLRPVNDAAVAESNDRQPYVKALHALIQSMLPDITDDEINRMGYKEVMSLISGLNEASQALKGYTIQEIASAHAVSHAQYQTLISDFKRRYRNLLNIKNSKYKYVRDFNGSKYYWIPIEDLP